MTETIDPRAVRAEIDPHAAGAEIDTHAAGAEIDPRAVRAQLGRKLVEHDVATAAPLRGMVVTFDRNKRAPDDGEPIDPGWHLEHFHADRKHRLSLRVAQRQSNPLGPGQGIALSLRSSQ